MVCEKYLGHAFLKYNNNDGFVFGLKNDLIPLSPQHLAFANKLEKFNKIVQSFSHFTLEYSLH